MRMKLYSIAAAALAIAACKPAGGAGMAQNSSAHRDSVKAGIDAMNASFVGHMLAGHVDSLMTFYADNATIMAPNMPAAHGTAAIKTFFDGMMSMGKPSAFTLTADEVSVAGDLAVERGHYTWTSMGPDHKTMADSGNYIVHWHKMGGTWKIVDDIWNSSNPAMPMPATPPRRS